ncbi:MAG: putative inorganic carbon transporter subunit DabA, partial [Rubripirellula sp.]
MAAEPYTSQMIAESDSIALRRMIENAAHLLPAQGPIEVFVHHNTLHAFEEQSFDDAVEAGLTRYHGQPYFSEEQYRRLYAAGRIVDSDLEAVLQKDLAEHSGEEVCGLGTRAEIRLAMLRHAVQIGPDAELRWIVAETDALERFRERATRLNRTRII